MAEFQRFIPCLHGYFDSIKTAIPKFGQLEFSFTKVPCGCFTVILLYFFAYYYSFSRTAITKNLFYVVYFFFSFTVFFTDV